MGLFSGILILLNVCQLALCSSVHCVLNWIMSSFTIRDLMACLVGISNYTVNGIRVIVCVPGLYSTVITTSSPNAVRTETKVLLVLRNRGLLHFCMTLTRAVDH